MRVHRLGLEFSCEIFLEHKRVNFATLLQIGDTFVNCDILAYAKNPSIMRPHKSYDDTPVTAARKSSPKQIVRGEAQ
jgi:hypothetical protein